MKTLTGFILAMLVMAVGVSAQSMPMIISGTIVTEGSPWGYEVTLTNMRTGQEAKMKTDTAGHFIFDPQNMREGAWTGDVFEVEVAGDVFIVDDLANIPIHLDIDLTDKVVCPDCPVVNCPDPECPDCEVCEDCPEPTVCDECPEPEECPEPTPTEAVDLLITALAAAAVTGSAVTLTLGAKAKHYHRGIRNKHSILTRHRDPDIRHPMGEVAPVYVKLNGRYVYEGSG